MAEAQSRDLLALLRKAGLEPDADFLREGVRVLTQALLAAEVAAHVGAGRGSATATASGSGTRASAPSP